MDTRRIRVSEGVWRWLAVEAGEAGMTVQGLLEAWRKQRNGPIEEAGGFGHAADEAETAEEVQR